MPTVLVTHGTSPPVRLLAATANAPPPVPPPPPPPPPIASHANCSRDTRDFPARPAARRQGQRRETLSHWFTPVAESLPACPAHWPAPRTTSGLLSPQPLRFPPQGACDVVTRTRRREPVLIRSADTEKDLT